MEVFKQETAQNYQSEKNSALAMKAGSMVMPKKGSTFYVVPELMVKGRSHERHEFSEQEAIEKAFQ